MLKLSGYKIMIITLVTLFSCSRINPGHTQGNRNADLQFVNENALKSGAANTELYFHLLKNKNIGVVCNHSSLIFGRHLVDILVSEGFQVKTIFSPEHGFRGNAEAGAEIGHGIDQKTGIRVVSLYGKNKKPLPADLDQIDILLFDIQDVGVRFYTYISTLTLVMEAAVEQGIPLIVLDRPNPNGFYVDGPLLDTAYRSFVGMHPVPVVYGMTIGEYARMINGEDWLNGLRCDLEVIPVEGYHHHMIVELNVSPSPNLPDWESIYLYPSVCFFEGTFISVGRGTDQPFQVIGHPACLVGSNSFTPRSIPGVSDHPPYEGQLCLGSNLTSYAENYIENPRQINLSWLIGMQEFFKDSTHFFNPYFDKLAGTAQLKIDILDKKTEAEIRQSWEADLLRFRQIRSKYLIYPE